MMMELRQIRYFIEVAKREHVTEAAEALHVAQSAVSRQIFNLEAELGVALFIRKGRNIKLTAIGKIFLEHMEQAIHAIEDAKQVVSEYTDPKRGTIQVGFPSSLATYILPTALAAFRSEYPDIRFKLNQQPYYDLIEAVIKGEINFALLAPVPTDGSEVRGEILFTEKIVALLPMSHPFAKESVLRLSQLRDDHFILFPEGFMLREVVERVCQQHGFRPNVSFEGEDIGAVKGLVSAGSGVSLIPESALVDHLPRATVAIPINEPLLTRTVGMIMPEDRQLLPTEKLFYEFLSNFFLRLEQFQK